MNSKIYRIIDVNINRAGEGLRVVEEVCRFVLEDGSLTGQMKNLRGKLLKIIRRMIENEIQFQFRRALEDAGRKIYSETEGCRAQVEDIFCANIKRAQEAVRCLEEFSKLVNPRFGKKFKEIRFQLYELEKRISLRLTAYGLQQKLPQGLYLVTDPKWDHLKAVKQALAAGIKIIQLRDKIISKKKYFRLAKKIALLAKKAGAVFILNDYFDLVRRVGAQGVHLGQEDLRRYSIAQVRKKLGKEKLIGVSTHSFSQALKAEKSGADYISVGPVFATPSKPGIKPVGLGLLRKVVKKVKIPVVAIGGINKSNLGRVKKTGANRFAMIRGLLNRALD